jgi:uncharacterized protein YndB with AHSA1/START domain
MITGTEQIVVEYSFPQPPAHVWRALTEPELLAAWLMPNDIAPVVGHKFNFRTQAAAQPRTKPTDTYSKPP